MAQGCRLSPTIPSIILVFYSTVELFIEKFPSLIYNTYIFFDRSTMQVRTKCPLVDVDVIDNDITVDSFSRDGAKDTVGGGK